MKQEIALHGSRLLRVLSGLLREDVAYPPPNLAQQLARLVSFQETEQLASLHTKPVGLKPDSLESAVLNIKDEVLNTRLALVQAIATSFVQGSSSRIRLPLVNANTSIDALLKFAPYHRFYAAHQRVFELKIQTLQSVLRDAIASQYPVLAELVVLDKGLRDVLRNHIGTLLAGIPKLLGRRFDSLLQQNRKYDTGIQESDEALWNSWTQKGAGLEMFLQDMQGLLLAELELRLLPLLGLIEAVEEQQE